MSCLAPLCLLAIFVVHCVYAQYSHVKTDVQDTHLSFILYDPSNGDQLDPLLYLHSTKLLRSNNINDNVIELPTMGMPCSCQDYTCKCCLGFGFSDMKQVLCIMINCKWQDLSVNFGIELNYRSVASFGISARDLPDICRPLILPIPVYGCLRLYNIRVVDRSMYVCISLVLKLVFQQLFEYKLNCLQLGDRGVNIANDVDWIGSGATLRMERQPMMVQTTNDKLEI